MGIFDNDVLVPTNCCACGVRFGIDKAFMDRLRNMCGGVYSTKNIGFDSDESPKIKETDDDDDDGDGGYFCCPNGHIQRYTEKLTDTLGEKLVEAKRKAENLEAENESLKKQIAELGGSRSTTSKGRTTKRKAAQE